ncbi:MULTISPECIES: response regulator [unclassified Streptomyces]|uniref:Response regulator transcription factor n=1 Tax=Streptomyces sp. NBC_00060 TaxID=2975636 RepID=A0AAU2HA47_9ACTN
MLTGSVRVVLADDHVTVRAGTRALLERAGFTVVGEAAGEKEAETVVARRRPDLLVLDMVLDSGPVLDAIPGLLAAAPGMTILMHTMHDDVLLVRKALAAGATGYLLKNTSVTELSLAAATVAAGGRYVQPSLGADLGGVAQQMDMLTPRESEVLELLAAGHTNREVAQRIGVSIRTVENVRASLRGRLNLVTRADLVAYARKQGDVRA